MQQQEIWPRKNDCDHLHKFKKKIKDHRIYHFVYKHELNFYAFLSETIFSLHFLITRSRTQFRLIFFKFSMREQSFETDIINVHESENNCKFIF